MKAAPNLPNGCSTHAAKSLQHAGYHKHASHWLPTKHTTQAA